MVAAAGLISKSTAEEVANYIIKQLISPAFRPLCSSSHHNPEAQGSSTTILKTHRRTHRSLQTSLQHGVLTPRTSGLT